MNRETDKYSFILGMITAFCECVAGGCKKLALSPPLGPEDYSMVAEEANAIIEKHGLTHDHERNLDQPEDKRVEWILIAGKRETIQRYLALREKGFSPMDSLAPFSELLSYDPANSVHTGYDAYQAYFGKTEDHEI